MDQSDSVKERRVSTNICIGAFPPRRSSDQFNLADYVQVRSAVFENGLLKIELFREIPVR